MNTETKRMTVLSLSLSQKDRLMMLRYAIFETQFLVANQMKIYGLLSKHVNVEESLNTYKSHKSAFDSWGEVYCEVYYHLIQNC